MGFARGENLWLVRQRIAEEEAGKLNLHQIEKVASALGLGGGYLHDIPVASFFDSKGYSPERNDVLTELVRVVGTWLSKLDKKIFNIAGGTYGGIERGVIHIRRDK